MDVRLRWWQWLLVVVSGIGLGVFADWLLGTYLRIPRVRFPVVLGTIVWLLLSPLLFDRERSR